MIGFIEDLWQSIFTPGATPTLILATHITFALLVTSLVTLIFLSNYNIHLIALLIISLALWGLLTWFIAELEASKESLKSNEEISKEEKPQATTTATATSTKKTTTRKSRKI